MSEWRTSNFYHARACSEEGVVVKPQGIVHREDSMIVLYPLVYKTWPNKGPHNTFPLKPTIKRVTTYFLSLSIGILFSVKFPDQRFNPPTHPLVDQPPLCPRGSNRDGREEARPRKPSDRDRKTPVDTRLEYGSPTY